MGDKIRENRLRRVAERQGKLLAKSRRRDPRALDYGLFVLVAEVADAAPAFARGEGVTLDEIESALR